MNTSRRTLLKGGAAVVTSMLLPVSPNALAALVSQSIEPPQGSDEINDWIWVNRQGDVVIGVSQCECGQGIFTGLAQVVAAEMDADWEHVSVRFVTARDAYRQVSGGVGHSQFVAASTSMTNFYTRVRRAGAQARELFAAAGAKHFNIPLGQCITKNSQVINIANNESVGYGDLLGYVSGIALNPNPRLKTNEEEKGTIAGQNIGRVDTPAKVDGSAIFGIDVDVPDMLIGVPWMAPTTTSKIINIRNEKTVRAMAGVVDLVQTRQWTMTNMKRLDPDMSLNTIVVVAKTFWQAKKAAEALDVEFDAGTAAAVNTETIDAVNQARIRREDLVTATSYGDAKGIVTANKGTDKYHEARYEMPYIAHATMEPCTTTVHYKGDSIEVWGSIQGQDLVRQVLGGMFKIAPEKVIVHTMFLGGSFGRKYVPDAAMHAAAASKAVGKPVKVIYTREIDIQHEYYRPGQIAHYEAVLDDKGYPEAVVARSAGQSLYWQLHRDTVERTGWDETMVEGVYNSVYDYPNFHVEMGFDEQPISLSFLRGVGSMANIFFYESFISELAHKAGIDEYQYRRHLLRNKPLALKTLDELAKVSDWNKPLPQGTYRGMAFNNWVARADAFVSPIGVVVEMKEVGTKLKINRVVCVIDCGRVVNPGLVEAQIQGGVGFALSAAMKGKLHIKDGEIVESNFDTYPVIRINEMPDVEVHTVKSDRPPQGTGEMSTAVFPPALASVLFQATGRHFRKTPFLDNINS